MRPSLRRIAAGLSLPDNADVGVVVETDKKRACIPNDTGRRAFITDSAPDTRANITCKPAGKYNRRLTPAEGHYRTLASLRRWTFD